MSEEEVLGSLIAVFPLHGETRNTFKYQLNERGLLDDGEMIGTIYVPKSSVHVLSSGDPPGSVLVVVQAEEG